MAYTIKKTSTLKKKYGFYGLRKSSLFNVKPRRREGWQRGQKSVFRGNVGNKDRNHQKEREN